MAYIHIVSKPQSIILNYKKEQHLSQLNVPWTYYTLINTPNNQICTQTNQLKQQEETSTHDEQISSSRISFFLSWMFLSKSYRFDQRANWPSNPEELSFFLLHHAKHMLLIFDTGLPAVRNSQEIWMSMPYIFTLNRFVSL